MVKFGSKHVFNDCLTRYYVLPETSISKKYLILVEWKCHK